MEAIDLTKERKSKLDVGDANVCYTCASCASGCPATGIDGLDIRKLVRMAALGMGDALIEAKWPWICTMCGRCEYACPMEVKILNLIRGIRSLRPRQDIPGTLHKGIVAALETGNNFSIPKDDFIFVMEDVAEEFAEEEGLPDFKIPFDKKGANILCTVHGKLPFAQTDDLKHWWKIFYAANESWTITSENWEGVNWALYTGDDAAMKTMVGRIVENMEKLEAKNLLFPE